MCVERGPRAPWWGAHLFSCPKRMVICKNREVFMGIGAFIEALND